MASLLDISQSLQAAVDNAGGADAYNQQSAAAGAMPLYQNTDGSLTAPEGVQLTFPDYQVGDIKFVDPGHALDSTVNFGLGTDGRIKIDAPDYYINSDEFKKNVLPAINSLQGQPIESVNTWLNTKNDTGQTFIDAVNQQAKQVADRFNAYTTYTRDNPGATFDNAKTYYATVYSDINDKNAEVNAFVGNGQFKPYNMADFINEYNNFNDQQKINYYNNLKTTADTGNQDQRAKALGIISLLERNKLNKMSTGGQILVGAGEFAKNLAETGLYSIPVGAAKRVNSSVEAPNDTAKSIENQINNIDAAFSNTDAASNIGNVLGAVTGIGLDFWLGSKLAAGAGSAGSGLADVTKLGSALNKATTIAKVASEGRAVGTALNTAINTGRTIGTFSKAAGLPQNIGYGVVRSAGSSLSGSDKQYDFFNDLALNTAINAGILTGIRSISPLAKMFDRATGFAISRGSEAAGKALIRGEEAISKMPIINAPLKLYNKITAQGAENLAAKYAYGRSNLSRGGYFELVNNSRNMKTGGAGMFKQFVTDTNAPGNAAKEYLDMHTLYNNYMNNASNGAYKVIKKIPFAERIAKHNNSITNADDILTKYSSYKQELQRIAGGAEHKNTENMLKAKQEFIDKHQSQELDDITDALSRFATKTEDLMAQHGVKNADIIKLMRDDPKYNGGFQHLAYSEGITTKGVQRKATGNKVADPNRVTKSLSGKAINPILVEMERAQAASKIIAQNQLAENIARLVDNGAFPGNIRLVPGSTQLKQSLKKVLADSNRVFSDRIANATSKNITRDVVSARDGNEIKEVTGDVKQVIDDHIDEMLSTLSSDKGFADHIDKFMPDYSNNIPQLANELAYINRSKLIDKVVTDFKSVGVLSANERSVVKNYIQERLGELKTLIPEDGGAYASIRQELKELDSSIQEAAGLPKAPDSTEIVFRRNGFEGKVVIDIPGFDHILQVAASRTSQGNFLTRLLQLPTKMFKLGTTGELNPVFLVVNPVRDIQSAAINSSFGVLEPISAMNMMLRATGHNEAQVAAANRAFKQNFNSATSFNEISNYAESAFKQADRLAIKNKYGEGARSKVIELFTNPKETLNIMGDLTSDVEMFSRHRVFSRAYSDVIERGGSQFDAIQEGLYKAGEATTNFINIADQLVTLNRFIPYLNTRIQGTASFMRLWQLDPIGVTSRIAGGIVYPVMLLTANNLSTPEKRDAYFRIPAYQRENNFVIVLDDGSNLLIPMSQEVANILNPFRSQVEAEYGMNPQNFVEAIAKPLLGMAPIDISGVLEKDMEGKYDIGGGISKALSGVTPEVARPFVEQSIGHNLFTGQSIYPSDAEIAAKTGNTNITDADRTFASKDSQALRAVSNALNSVGVSAPQGLLQNIISSYSGNAGQYFIDAIDRMAGAPPDRIGGKSILNAAAARFIGRSFDQSDQAFWDGVNKLEAEKQTLLAALEKDNKNYAMGNETERAKAIEDHKAEIDKFGRKVANFADSYSKFYNATGGLDSKNISTLIGIMNLSDAPTATPGSLTYNQQQEAFFGGRDSAIKRLIGNGVDVAKQDTAFGRIVNGLPDFSKSSVLTNFIKGQIYGAPKEVANDALNLLKGRGDIPSLSSMYSAYQDKVQPLYNKLKTLTKGTKDYQETSNAISDAIKQYNQEYDVRVQPMFDKYGVAVLNNKDVMADLVKYAVVPREDWTTSANGRKFLSTTSFPLATADTRQWLLERYGAGGRDTSSLTSDAEVRQAIVDINNAIDIGQAASARAKADKLQTQIDNGKLYISANDLQALNNLRGI